MSVKQLIYSLLILFSFLTGLVLISLKKNWIILNFRTVQLTQNQPDSQTEYARKKATIWFWQNSSWRSEQTEILVGRDQAHNLINLTQNWLAILKQEQILPDQINLQTILITPNHQTAYISFDQVLFNKNDSTYQKLILIESLLKTWRANKISTPHIQFLVQHQVMPDPHLDFDNPWPLAGFITTN